MAEKPRKTETRSPSLSVTWVVGYQTPAPFAIALPGTIPGIRSEVLDFLLVVNIITCSRLTHVSQHQTLGQGFLNPNWKLKLVLQNYLEDLFKQGNLGPSLIHLIQYQHLRIHVCGKFPWDDSAWTTISEALL